MSKLVGPLTAFIYYGQSLELFRQYAQWLPQVELFLEDSFGVEVADAFRELPFEDGEVWNERLPVMVQYLDELLQYEKKRALIENEVLPGMQGFDQKKKKVFIVHGHDELAKEKTARFVEQLGLQPVILHEQPNSGATIIEKFVKYSDVSYAIVLLTPDDVGAPKNEENTYSSRARQNVVFEFGYFLSALGRKNVCALLKGSVEKPSDIQGVLYIAYDEMGAWRQSLFKELKDSGFDVAFPS